MFQTYYSVVTLYFVIKIQFMCKNNKKKNSKWYLFKEKSRYIFFMNKKPKFVVK